ncbi:MAG: hypothetical protein IPM77_10715 [Crocinitomicaceae bacterium]|jgi:hypothetical protein|nr:hypothetical protein [Crocinitomicaceae bacterium]
MKRNVFLAVLMLFLFSGVARSSVYIKYYNGDSKTYTWDVKIAGVMTKVEFGGSRTSSVTIQGGSSDCIIYTPCGEFKVSNDMKITIKNGCISVG